MRNRCILVACGTLSRKAIKQGCCLRSPIATGAMRRASTSQAAQAALSALVASTDHTQRERERERERREGGRGGREGCINVCLYLCIYVSVYLSIHVRQPSFTPVVSPRHWYIHIPDQPGANHQLLAKAKEAERMGISSFRNLNAKAQTLNQ